MVDVSVLFLRVGIAERIVTADVLLNHWRRGREAGECPIFYSMLKFLFLDTRYEIWSKKKAGQADRTRKPYTRTPLQFTGWPASSSKLDQFLIGIK